MEPMLMEANASIKEVLALWKQAQILFYTWTTIFTILWCYVMSYMFKILLQK